MANNVPCNQQPIQFISCCDVMDCIDIKSTDNSVTVIKNGCGVDLKITGNNLDQIIQFNDSECITWTKEFIEGKLVITPTLDFNCITSHLNFEEIADNVCEICNPPVCPIPIGLAVIAL